MSSNYGSTKFLMCLVVVVFASALMWFGKITDAVWLGACSAAIGAYAASNVIEKIKTG